MRRLYVLSKAYYGKPRLIGELTEENGEYTFEYKLGGEFHERFLKIDEFPEPDKVYNGSQARSFVERLIPPRDSWYINDALKAAGLAEYDEWGFLKYREQIRFNPREDVYLYENLPDEVVKYGH